MKEHILQKFDETKNDKYFLRKWYNFTQFLPSTLVGGWKKRSHMNLLRTQTFLLVYFSLWLWLVFWLTETYCTRGRCGYHALISSVWIGASNSVRDHASTNKDALQMVGRGSRPWENNAKSCNWPFKVPRTRLLQFVSLFEHSQNSSEVWHARQTGPM